MSLLPNYAEIHAEQHLLPVFSHPIDAIFYSPNINTRAIKSPMFGGYRWTNHFANCFGGDYILLAQHHYNLYNGLTGLDSFNLLGSAKVSVGVGF